MQLMEVGSIKDLTNGNRAYRNITRMAPSKETIVLPTGGYAIVRFRANNPGYWFLESLNIFEMLTGMQMIIKIGKRYETPLPPIGFPTCSDYPKGLSF